MNNNLTPIFIFTGVLGTLICTSFWIEKKYENKRFHIIKK